MTKDHKTLQKAVTEALARHGKRGKDGGHCHIIALEALCCSKVRSARLVQGLARYGDFHVAHSWLVIGDTVMDLDGTYTTKEWDLKREPKQCFVYTFAQAVEMALKHQNYGPWEDELCNHDRLMKALAGLQL